MTIPIAGDPASGALGPLLDFSNQAVRLGTQMEAVAKGLSVIQDRVLGDGHEGLVTEVRLLQQEMSSQREGIDELRAAVVKLQARIWAFTGAAAVLIFAAEHWIIPILSGHR